MHLLTVRSGRETKVSFGVALPMIVEFDIMQPQSLYGQLSYRVKKSNISESIVARGVLETKRYCSFQQHVDIGQSSA